MMGALGQSFINGITIGSSYALVAVGFTLIFGVLRVVYLSHAAVLAACAYIGYGVIEVTNSAVAAIVVATLAGAVLGVVIERIAIRPVRGQNHLIPMVTSISVAIIIEETLRLTVLSGQPISYPDTFASTVIRLHVGGAEPYFTVGQVLIFALTFALVLTLRVVVQRTWVGRAMRAVADSEDVSSLVGVRVNATSARTMALASMLAGAAGVLLALSIGAIDAHFAEPLQFKALAIVLFAGLGSIPGAVVGGYLLGFVEAFAAGYLDTSYRDLFAYVLMIAILMMRPQGLFGRRLTQRV
ncbi:branched-chain amino acid ABC transporter permease [Paraburkholderia sp. BL10I2N1]|uniref:branched-chain amino acid ABC transporter permease n=1 Tax=unclassified Paraburkholderia TaxID=2615204 RepID=UPI00105CA981|nr:branched-chain amino acid ABC transporter permease [Paraburkholderia sp. BL10I2N1]TDN62366.1 amino acid/amide ABC transporter membrane protein 1 (HAAT family) [Paraburkholderia sp. BL10I2N1]